MQGLSRALGKRLSKMKGYSSLKVKKSMKKAIAEIIVEERRNTYHESLNRKSPALPKILEQRRVSLGDCCGYPSFLADQVLSVHWIIVQGTAMHKAPIDQR